MRQMDIIRRAGRNLRQAKARTFLTAIAIAVGAFTISLALAAGEGGRTLTDDMVGASGDAKSIHVVYVPQRTNPDQLPEYEQSSSDSQQLLRNGISDKELERIRNISGVYKVTPQVSVEATYVQGNESSKKLVAPLSIKSDETTLHFVAGSLKNYQPKAGYVSIPDEYVKQLGFRSASDAIGKTITVHLQKPGVLGDIVKEQDLELKIQAVDGKTDTTLFYSPSIRLSASDGEKVSEFIRPDGVPDTVMAVSVQAHNAVQVDTIAGEIRQNRDLHVSTMQDVRQSMMQLVNVAQWALVGFGALALLASVFGIINTMYISVLERTQQIGLMKALGMRSRDIGKMFRYEAAWVGLLGGSIGVVLAYFVTFLNPFIAEFLRLQADTKLLILQPVPVVILLVGLMLLAVVAGLLPSRKAAKLNPVDALKTE